jgi:hypothetical protein
VGYWDSSETTRVEASDVVVVGSAAMARVLSAHCILAARGSILKRFTVRCQADPRTL